MEGPLLPYSPEPSDGLLYKSGTYRPACASLATLALVLAMAGGGACSYHQLPVRPSHAGRTPPAAALLFQDRF